VYTGDEDRMPEMGVELHVQLESEFELDRKFVEKALGRDPAEWR